MKVYYTVQIVERQNVGYKTYTQCVVDKKMFKEEDVKKAISLWKKRASNEIIRTTVEYLDDMPYVHIDNCFGTKEPVLEDGRLKPVLSFKTQNITFYL